MKRHYEIMRIMRIKVVDFRDLWESAQSILYIEDAITYRVDGLTSASVHLSSATFDTHMIDPLIDNFSQQRLDPEKQFQSFAHGIVGCFASTP